MAHTDASGSQGTPETSPRLLVSQPEDLNRLSDGELNARVREAQAAVRTKRKHEYLAAVQRGEAPDYDPFAFDEAPVALQTETRPAKRGRSEVWGKIQLPNLNYDGKKWSDLTTFLFDLESRFTVDL